MKSDLAVILLDILGCLFGIGTEAGEDQGTDSHDDRPARGKGKDSHKNLYPLHAEGEQIAGIESEQEYGIVNKDSQPS